MTKKLPTKSKKRKGTRAEFLDAHELVNKFHDPAKVAALLGFHKATILSWIKFNTFEEWEASKKQYAERVHARNLYAKDQARMTDKETEPEEPEFEDYFNDTPLFPEKPENQETEIIRLLKRIDSNLEKLLNKKNRFF